MIVFNPGLVPCGTGAGQDIQEKKRMHSGTTLTGDNGERDSGLGSVHGSDDGRPDTVNDSTREHRRRGWSLIRGSAPSVGGNQGDIIPLETGESLRTIPYASMAPISPAPGPRRPSPVHLDMAAHSPPTSPTHENPGPWESLQQPVHESVLDMPPPLRPRPPPSEYNVSRPQSLALWMLPKNLHVFYNMEAFICENDGLPKWCFHCHCWKPDRSHHCGELGRCIKKMDHFCPWYVNPTQRQDDS